IVVVIIAIIAAIAIPQFTSYVQRSRVTEAATFLGEIRQKQEAYRAEFGQFCDVGGGSAGGGWNPATTPTNGQSVDWGTPPTGWTQLGARPDGPVRFNYSTWAGVPGTAPTGTNHTGFGNNDFWFVAQAQSDLNGDGNKMTLEAVSWSNIIWNSA